MASSWFYQRDGEVFGPVSAQELLAAAHLGFLRPEDLVRRCDRRTWRHARGVKGLFASNCEPRKEERA